MIVKSFAGKSSEGIRSLITTRKTDKTKMTDSIVPLIETEVAASTIRPGGTPVILSKKLIKAVDGFTKNVKTDIERLRKIVPSSEDHKLQINMRITTMEKDLFYFKKWVGVKK